MIATVVLTVFADVADEPDAAPRKVNRTEARFIHRSRRRAPTWYAGPVSTKLTDDDRLARALVAAARAFADTLEAELDLASRPVPAAPSASAKKPRRRPMRPVPGPVGNVPIDEVTMARCRRRLRSMGVPV